MTTENIELNQCIDKLATDYNRYYWAVHITLGFKDYLDKNIDDCRFVYVEKKLKLVEDDDKYNTPDFILQYNEDKNGIICEIKSSLTYIEEYLKRDLFSQLEKYCKDMKGWETNDGRIDNHDILCIIHSLDVRRATKLIIDSLENNDLNMDKNLCISEWAKLTSPKYPGREIILIKYEHGELGCKTLEEQLKSNIEFSVDDLSLIYEMVRFTRNPPPVQYSMDLLWTQIFPIFEIGYRETEVEITLEQILVEVYNYYTTWSRIEGEYSQVRRSWIKDAMDKFTEIGLVEIIDEAPLKYKIFINKKLNKNVKEYIFEEICKIELGLKSDLKRKDKQTAIDDFTETKEKTPKDGTTTRGAHESNL